MKGAVHVAAGLNASDLATNITEQGERNRREHGAYQTSGGDQLAQSILLDVSLRPPLPKSNFVKCRIVGLP